MDAQALLLRETAHLSPSEKAEVRRLYETARQLVADTPRADDRALADKLATLSDTPRWVRVLVSKAAVAAGHPAGPLFAAA